MRNSGQVHIGMMDDIRHFRRFLAIGKHIRMVFRHCPQAAVKFKFTGQIKASFESNLADIGRFLIGVGRDFYQG